MFTAARLEVINYVVAKGYLERSGMVGVEGWIVQYLVVTAQKVSMCMDFMSSSVDCFIAIFQRSSLGF